MDDKRCFVQFPHPGLEHEPDRYGKKAWSKDSGRHRGHRRKFMSFRGEWIGQDSSRHIGDLWAWGEWEPESELIRELQQPGGDPQYPRYLWHPYFVPKDNYQGLHNTDPFIFGEKFLYSNCRQRSNPSLTHLGHGSVIAFGSGKKINGEQRWMLDTVLVVKDSVDYQSPEMLTGLSGILPEAFLVATGRLLHDSGRLYKGATFDDPVDGMFSFFPAIPADGDSGFPRPLIDLPCEYFNRRNSRAPKGVRQDRASEEIRGIWDSLVSQVRANGLVLGTFASLPERRL